MRLLFIITLSIIITGCAEKPVIKETPKEEKPVVIIEDPKPKEEVKPSTGWSDKDTYTVNVTATNIDSAKNAAKHKILQDIVKVRMFNESRFTDITKISAEFDKPLKDGKILMQKQTSAGVEIYFQIKEEGLKEKFERK